MTSTSTFTRTYYAGRSTLEIGRVSLSWKPRVISVFLLISALTFLVLILALALGKYEITPIHVAKTLFGGGSKLDHTIVVERRLPRGILGILIGYALGIAGALTQATARNALASPDILGITQGAAAAAVTVIVFNSVFGGAVWGKALSEGLSAITLPLVALLGALITATLIWVLAWRKGVDPFRLVLIGIALSAILHAYVMLLMVTANIRDVGAARVWLSGSLSDSKWPDLRPVIIALIIVLPVVAWLSFQLHAIVLGSQAASGLGVSHQWGQALLLLAAVVLSAAAVAAAGPIGFVAFVAPQVAMRLAGTPTQPLLTSGAVGALLVTFADLIGRSALPWEVPVGLVTSAIGAPFLIHLLIRANRRTNA